MKRILLSLILLFAAGLSLSANVQKIKVVSADDGADLPFSYVYINGVAFGSANKNAETFIPLSLIRDGDFISASYVGYNNTSIEYIDPQEVYVIEMGRSTLQTIKVFTPQETRRQLRVIRHRAPLARASDFKFEFVFDVNGKKFCAGDFYHYFNSQIDQAILKRYPLDFGTGGSSSSQNSDEEEIQFFGEEPAIEATDNIHNRIYVELPEDMEGVIADPRRAKFVRETMIPIMQDVFYTASRGVVTLPDYIQSCGVKVRKIGGHGRHRQFILTREDNGRSFDKVVSSVVLLEVDTLIYDVRSARMNITKRDGRIELIARYGVYGYFRYPYVVEATYFMNDGTRYAMVLYNTRATYADKPHVFRRRNSANIWDLDNELVDGQKSWIRTWGEVNLESSRSIQNIQGNDYPTILYKQLVEETQATGGGNELLFREKLEVLALANSVWQ